MKEAILNKSTELYFQNGDFTIDELVKEFKMSKTTFYVHFHTKDDVYAEMITRAFPSMANMPKRFHTKHMMDLLVLLSHTIGVGYEVSSVSEVNSLFGQVIEDQWKRFLPVFERNR